MKLVLRGRDSINENDIIKIFKWESLEDAQKILKETIEHNIEVKEDYERRSYLAGLSGGITGKKYEVKQPDFRYFLGENIVFNYEILTLEDFIERHTYKFEKLVTTLGETE